MEQSVAVVILNWNGKAFLQQFLPSVVKHSNHQNITLWLADNASIDDSVSYVAENYPSIKIFENTTNEGFAGGYNTAFKNIKADIYVLLNSDVEVSHNWIAPIVEAMENDDNIAAAQPKIKSQLQKSHFEYAGAAGGYIDKYGYPFCRGRVFNHLEQDNGQYDKESNLFWASGACLFIKSKIWHQLKGLDADFFAHMEEIDLCWRIQRLGYVIKYIPQSTIYHVGGGTLPKSNPRKTYLNFRNNLFMLVKNLHPKTYTTTLIKRWLLDGIAWLILLISFKFSEAFAVNKAHVHFLRDYKKFKQKRKELSALDYPSLETQFDKSIVFQYYAKGKKLFSQLSFKKDIQ